MLNSSLLWDIGKCSDWHSAIERYPAIIEMQQVNGLEELDEWYRMQLPGLIAKRKPPQITPEELERVTKWKMKRGVWRERNRLLVVGNSAAVVKETSIKAFAAVPDQRRPIDILSQLAGVGPATASAILAAYAPDVYPFFDELVAAQIPALDKVAFTAAYYQRYAAALRDRAEQLQEKCRHQKWTAQEVSQALWSASGGKVTQTAK